MVKLQSMMIKGLFSVCLAGGAWGQSQAQISKAQLDKIVGPKPEWVEDINLPLEANGVKGALRTTQHIVDRQVHIKSAEEYLRVVYTIEDAAALTDYSQVKLNFEPEREDLVLHEVNIRRQGRILPSLHAEDFRIYDNEPVADEKIYIQSKNIDINLKGVQVGDTIEYSFTRHTKPDAFGDHFSRAYAVQYTMPIKLYRLRVLQEPARRLYYQSPASLGEPKLKLAPSGQQVYEWMQQNLPALPADDRAPEFVYQPLRVSTFASWGEFADLAVKLFPARDLPRELDERMQTWSKLPDSMQKIAAAVLFVQKEIRYLSLSIGSHGWQPHDPMQVLKNGYGDCKDKSYLLTLILQRLGFSASIALVNATESLFSAESLPGAHNFDHVIVALEFQNRTYWIDPTQDGDEGRFKDYPPYFGEALRLRPGENSLTPMNDNSRQKLEMDQSSIFTVLDDGKLRLDRTISLYGHHAADLQDYLKDSGVEDYQNFLVNTYSTDFGATSPEGPLQVEPGTDGSLVIRGKFLIQPKLRNGKIFLGLSLPSEIFMPPKYSLRQFPLSIEYPDYVREKVSIRGRGHFADLGSSKDTIESPYYQGQLSWTISEHEAKGFFEYKALGPVIPVQGVETYLKDGLTLRNKEGLELDLSEPAAALSSNKTTTMMAMALGLVLLGLGAWWLWKRSVVERPSSAVQAGSSPLVPLLLAGSDSQLGSVPCQHCRRSGVEVLRSGRLVLDKEALRYEQRRCNHCGNEHILYVKIDENRSDES